MDTTTTTKSSIDNEEVDFDEIVENLFQKNSSKLWDSKVTNFLKTRIDFYKEENAKLGSVLTRLNLLEDRRKLNGIPCRVALQETDRLLKEVKHLVHIPDLDKYHMRKHSNYTSKLKICIKLYCTLNEKLSRDIKFLKSELQSSKTAMDQLLTLSNDDLKAMEMKIKRYENELVKFEKKYPWLKDKNLALPNISREVEALEGLRLEKENLVKELDVYHGLKPNITEATQQLAKVKSEYRMISEKLLE